MRNSEPSAGYFKKKNIWWSFIMLKGPKKKTVLFSPFYFLCSETDTASVFDSKWNIIMSVYIDLYARMPTRH